MKPAILLFKGKGIISSLIRWQTRGQYSHAAILMRDGRIVESWQGKGVRITEVKDWTNIDVYDVDGMTDEMWDDAIAFAVSQVGKKYDYKAVLRFVSRIPSGIDRKWFCSELVFESVFMAGKKLLNTFSWKVSPTVLSWSPYLFLRQ